MSNNDKKFTSKMWVKLICYFLCFLMISGSLFLLIQLVMQSL